MGKICYRKSESMVEGGRNKEEGVTCDSHVWNKVEERSQCARDTRTVMIGRLELAVRDPYEHCVAHLLHFIEKFVKPILSLESFLLDIAGFSHLES